MSRTLAIELNDDLQQQLLERWRKQNISLESLVLRSLTKLVTSPSSDEFDPILPLLGTSTADASDIGENPDFYRGTALQKEGDRVE